MENSGKIVFGEDKSEWYIAVGDHSMGPFRPSEVHEKIQSQLIGWAHYVWKKGQPEWKRICDVKAFQVMLPRQPNAMPSPSAPSPAVKKAPPASARTWFFHHQGSQYGPFSEDEVQQFLVSGRINADVFAWKQGMENWQKIKELSVFAGHARTSLKTPSKKTETKKSEQRTAPRQPLLAQIIISDDQTVIVGVCRDISVGGLQVLADSIPGKVGTQLKMNISPSGKSSGQPIEPFVAEGVIVRILEDGRGFSFRFKKLNDRARNAIEAYIESASESNG